MKENFINEQCSMCKKTLKIYKNIFVSLKTDKYLCKKCVKNNNLLMGKDISHCFYIV